MSATVPTENCPNCLAAQPITAMRCGECRFNLTEPFSRGERLRLWLKRNDTMIYMAGGLFFLWMILVPAPYNPQYWFKRAFYTEKAVCRDGIYSFSAARSGTCSGHGGVARWLD